MNGYFLLNKPKGISSFYALIKAKDSLAKASGIPFKKIKIGHAGTLDPLAQGVLLCTIGKSTKMLSHLLLSDKKYIATLQFGKVSETDDDEGAKKVPDYFQEKVLLQEEIQLVIEKYIGEIMQTPPVFSALKVNGKRSCDRIRNASASLSNRVENIQEQMQEEMKKKSKKIQIFDIQILDYSYPSLTIEVHCGTGTYIRSLVRDIGKDLKQGAYLSFLERTQVGDFFLEDAVSPFELEEKNIISFAPHHFSFPSIILQEKIIVRLQHGQRININDIECIDEEKNIFEDEYISQMLFWNSTNELIGMGEKKGGILVPRKNLV